jgi:hypothetical protein
MPRVLMVGGLVGVMCWVAAGRADEPTPRYRKARVIDSVRGDGAGQVAEELRGLTIGPDGMVYAVGDSKLVVLSPEGTVVRSWKTERPGYCVTVVADGTAYVGEPGQVEIFGGDGSLKATWRDAERLTLVTSIVVTDKSVLCADARGRCIRRFDRDGKYQGDIGKSKRLRGFMLPNGYLDFAVDREGVIHSADPGRHRVVRFSTAGEKLGWIGRFDPKSPAGFTGCCNPTNIALAPGGRIVAVVKAPPAVKVYNQDGGLLAVLGKRDLEPNCKNSDVAVDADGRIYVIDTVRLQILVYEPVSQHAASDKTETQP